MYKHPISAFFRLLPAVSWLTVCAVALRMPLSIYLSLTTEGRWNDITKVWPDALVLLGFVAVAIYAARMAYKAYKEALPALRADTPIRLDLVKLGLPIRRRPPPFTPTRYPLSEALRAELHQLIETLQNAGMLLPGEVAIDQVIDCAETFDEWSQVDLYMAMNVLHALHAESKRPFANITFVLIDAETDAVDAVHIVQELARLCGRLHELKAVRVRSIDGGKILPPQSLFPPPNAVAEFELGAQHHEVPFVLYPKTLPGGLIEALAKIFISANDPRRFVWDNFDSFFSISYLTPAQTSLVNSAERAEFPRFQEVA